MFRSRSPMIKRSDKMTSFITVLWRYIIYSGLFWAVFSLLSFIILYDSNYGEKSKLYFFSSLNLSSQLLAIIFLLIIFSGCIGGLLAFPAIIIKIFLKIQVDTRLHKGQRPILLAFTATYLPIIFCVYIHFMALIMSTSAAPQLMRRWFDKNSSIYDMQEKFYNKFYENKKTEIYSKWNLIGKNSDQDSKFIFILPDYLLTHSNSFRESKIVLSEENKWLQYSPTKASLTATLLGKENLTDEKLYIPSPLQNFRAANQNKSEKSEISSDYFIGIDGKNNFVFSQIFDKSRLSNNISPTWINIYLNRIALSQPQLMFFFRIGLGGFFFSAWKWENLTSSNSFLLSHYADKVLSFSKTINNFIILLPEMEHSKENNFISSIDWPEYISKNEFDNNIDKIDYYLSFAIKGLLDANQNNIIIMPANKTNNSITLGKGYSKNISSHSILSPEIINQKIIKKSSDTTCSSIFFNFELNQYNKSTQNKYYFLLDTISSKKDSSPFIKKDFALGIKEGIKYGVICQNEKGSTYIVLRKEGIFNKGNHVNKFSYRNIHNQIFLNVDNKLKKFESEKYLAVRNLKNFEKMNPSSDSNLNEFYKQFDIYLLNINDTINYNSLEDSDKDQFIKKYGSEVKSKFYSFIQYSIK
ncbi:hypothetical protein [Fluviispira vulneris]|uniref:hypothetical protein n=1 Tax=Fluviispira vulneris TaxID=2763012 RepID=UPI00164420EA|nr:hypothetical protein [Fluviispira vulneris]